MVGRALLVVTALLVAPLLGGCTGSDDDSPKPTAAPTPIGKLDTGSVQLARAEFCDRLGTSAVEAALGGEPTHDDTWGNGDPVPGAAGGSGEVGHELGCAWTGAGGATARAWLFARPVTTPFAKILVARAGRTQGCAAAQTPVFGSPAVLQTCTLADNVERVRRAGLFGDTWLTCEVSDAPAVDLAKRTDRWCAAVVSAATSG
jgi:hypothetical protein